MKVYEVITKKIIEGLKEGHIPWKKPYAEIGLPRNYDTGRIYNGLNLLLFSAADFPDNRFITQYSLRKKKETYNKWEDSLMAVYWKKNIVEDLDDKGNDTKKTYWNLFYHYLWNVSKTSLWEGIQKENKAKETVKINTVLIEPEALLQKLLQKVNAKLNASNIPSYVPSKHVIKMPLKNKFKTIERYYSTYFHEISHSTIHESLLNRTKTMRMSEYTFEELVAEISTTFLLYKCGLDPIIKSNHQAYINGWLEKLNDDPKMIVKASGLAQKIVKFLLKEN